MTPEGISASSKYLLYFLNTSSYGEEPDLSETIEAISGNAGDTSAELFTG